MLVLYCKPERAFAVVNIVNIHMLCPSTSPTLLHWGDYISPKRGVSCQENTILPQSRTGSHLCLFPSYGIKIWKYGFSFIWNLCEELVSVLQLHFLWMCNRIEMGASLNSWFHFFSSTTAHASETLFSSKSVCYLFFENIDSSWSPPFVLCLQYNCTTSSFPQGAAWHQWGWGMTHIWLLLPWNGLLFCIWLAGHNYVLCKEEGIIIQ